MIRTILTALFVASACPVQAELRVDRTDEDAFAGANGIIMGVFS